VGAENVSPIILLDHSPTDLDNVSKSRVDLQLSGHTHNGQLFPVNVVVMPFQYELPWGTIVKRHTVFTVTSVVQAWGLPVKTSGDSEILSIKVTFRSCTNVPKMQPITQWATNLCMKTIVPGEKF
jgi:predicted MPP superfamily phosphohydrolase